MLLSLKHKTVSSDHSRVGGRVGQVKLHREGKSAVEEILTERLLRGRCWKYNHTEGSL